MLLPTDPNFAIIIRTLYRIIYYFYKFLQKLNTYGQAYVDPDEHQRRQHQIYNNKVIYLYGATSMDGFANKTFKYKKYVLFLFTNNFY